MQPELVFKAMTASAMGIAIITVLLLLLIGLWRESDGGQPIRGVVHFGIVIIALCTFLALMVAIFSARRMIVPEKISTRLDTAKTAADRREGPRLLRAQNTFV